MRKGDSTTGARAAQEALAPAAVEAAAALVLNSLLAQGCRWSQGRCTVEPNSKIPPKIRF